MPRLRLLVPALTAVLLAVTTSAYAGTPGSDAVPPRGPDVSGHQHGQGTAIDWPAVAAGGVSFVFVKATESNWYVNPWFARDYQGARDAGLVRSAYHFARPTPDLASATAQADMLLRVAGVGDQPGDLPLTLDLEQSGGLSPAQLVAWTQRLLDRVEQATGRAPLIYTYPYFWATAMGGTSAFTRYPLWIASYQQSGPALPLPGGWRDWTFWQHTDRSTEPGILGGVDGNRFRGSVDELRALARLPVDPPLVLPGPEQLVRKPLQPGARTAPVGPVRLSPLLDPSLTNPRQPFARE